MSVNASCGSVGVVLDGCVVVGSTEPPPVDVPPPAEGVGDGGVLTAGVEPPFELGVPSEEELLGAGEKGTGSCAVAGGSVSGVVAGGVCATVVAGGGGCLPSCNSV
jgi:hypothetical protein